MPTQIRTAAPQPERRAAPRGRGAGTNPTGRFERLAREAFDDGWDIEEELPPLRTEVAIDRSRSVLVRNTSPDLPFDRSVNPYRGCEHGCTYCYARPSHAQLGLSPGLDFETRLTAKPDAPRLLAAALARPGYRPAPIALGTNTDPYQPVEKRWRIMRGILEVLGEHRHPVTITTKGALIVRDLDILGELGRAGLAHVQVSLTSLDPRLSRAMEPRAASPGRRLMAVRALAEAGVPVGVNLAPIIPALNDHEIERLVAAAAEAGACTASHIVLRLPREVASLFREWLERAFPDRAARVMARVRELHGGRDYDPAWGKRMTGQGVLARLIAQRVAAARRRHGLDRPWPALRTDAFRRPPRPGDQPGLFD
ncbi:MAG TPA: PA0069 family radical SAM protein [Thermohalobaculum sp.]|nr:PA0069 family radical SAM protein [Thermohalobaculum sp.]